MVETILDIGRPTGKLRLAPCGGKVVGTDTGLGPVPSAGLAPRAVGTARRPFRPVHNARDLGRRPVEGGVLPSRTWATGAPSTTSSAATAPLLDNSTSAHA